jgi:hypothetical protein
MLTPYVTLLCKFYVHGSVHLGNVYVQLKVQLDVRCTYYVFFIPFYFLALHDRAKSAMLSQPVPVPMD